MDDVRWIQRLSNYCKALAWLGDAVRKYNESQDDIVRLAVVKCFEFTHELAWKVMKDYAEYQGYQDIQGSRDAIRRALAMGIITDPVWMDSIKSRNLTAHTYDNETADEVVKSVVSTYYPLFQDLETTMTAILETK